MKTGTKEKRRKQHNRNRQKLLRKETTELNDGVRYILLLLFLPVLPSTLASELLFEGQEKYPTF